MKNKDYTAMTDDELIAFGKKKGPWLEDETFVLLRAEFIRRNLDDGLILASEEKQAAHYGSQQKRAQTFGVSGFLSPAWQYAIHQKAAGADDSEIHRGLLEKGIDDTEALAIIAGIEAAIPLLIAHFKQKRWNGAMLVIGGFLFVLLTAIIAPNGFVLIPTGSIVWGGVRAFRADEAKRAYEEMQDSFDLKGKL